MWRLHVSSSKQRDQKQEERQKERKNERHAGEKGWEEVPAPVRPSSANNGCVQYITLEEIGPASPIERWPAKV